VAATLSPSFDHGMPNVADALLIVFLSTSIALTAAEILLSETWGVLRFGPLSLNHV